MKKLFTTLMTVMLLVTGATATETLDMKKIFGGYYYPQSISGMRPLNDGEHFARIEDGATCIVKYSYKTGEAVDTLFSVNNCRGCDFRHFDNYILSPKEDRILIQTKTRPIYRRSFTAEYYIYSVKNRKMVPLSTGGPQQVPMFSPDGNMIAFVRDNNIFLVKLLFNNSESQVTHDGKRNEVLNGIPDWVYEEEFSMDRAYSFSADSKMLAYVRSEETAVPSFSFVTYKGMAPAHPENELYPGFYTYKYPVPGEVNSKVSVHSFDIKTTVTRQIDVPLDADGYIPRIHFTSDPERLAVITLNRHQNRMDIYMANPRSTVCKLAVREEDPYYVNEPAYTDIAFYPDHFVLSSERDGYNHLYLYNLNGVLKKQLTKGEFEVTRFYGWDQETGDVYYQSNECGATRKAVYRQDKKGRKTRLTPETGTSDASFSANHKYFVHTHSDIHTPPVITVENLKGDVLRTLVDNKQLAETLSQPGMPVKEFFQFTTSEGVNLNGWMIRPADMKEGQRYPVIMYQYSGPGSQEVLDSWSMGFMGGGVWESFLAQKGFIVACVDGRGTGGRGAEFKKCTYLNIGIKESTDQIEAAKYLGTLPYVDKNNIAIWGWSFGGYNTLMSMTSGEPVFKAGVAVAPPTDWRFYDTVYTERFMRTPQENREGYVNGSAVHRAANLNGNLLVMHGMSDDNVHLRNSVEFCEALVQADKQFEMQYYANRNHSIFGGNTRRHLFTRMLNFWEEHLK